MLTRCPFTPKAAIPEKEVFVLFGDKAFGLTGVDIDTLVRFDLPFVRVVGNNAGGNPDWP
jgi:thiamine pyrophosphate-dependent acetolactate synthase large subunit-like protein